MTKRRPHFWYCFTCNEKVPEWHAQPAKNWHTLPKCNVHEAMVMRVPDKTENS